MVGSNVNDLDTPALLVDLDKLERNIQRMANTIIDDAGVHWRPHTKGVKVPAIVHMELAAGAIGITCAKLAEAEVMAASGISDILIANQVVGEQKVSRLVNLCKRVNVIVSVDSTANVRELEAAVRQKGIGIGVVVEVNVGMDRCGVEPGKPTLALSKIVHESPHLHYLGLMAWEGQARRFKDPEERRRVCEEVVGLLTGSANLCREAGLPVEIVSCGGTGTHEFSSRLPGVTEIQAGGGVLGDVYYDSLGVGQEFALTVLTTVVSRPAPNRIIVDGGFKTMSTLNFPPKPIGLNGVKSVSLSAEHGKVELESANNTLQVGDKLEFIVGYSDATVFLHDEMYGTRGGIVEVIWPILGRGKLR